VTKKKDKYTRIVNKLRERARKEGSLPPVLEAYNRLLGLQLETKSRIEAKSLQVDQETATARLREGKNLLAFEELSLDWVLLADLFRAVGQFIAENITHEAADAAPFSALSSDSQSLQKAVGDWYRGESLKGTMDEDRISEELLSSAIQATLYPFLITHAEPLQRLVRQDIWRKRTCPICGGKPDFAFLDTERGARWLVCSRCDTEWLFQRLECPFCGTQTHTELAYYADKDGIYRLYTCKKCQRYIKAIDLRKAGGEVLLPLERALTADLDRQGVEAGFKPG